MSSEPICGFYTQCSHRWSQTLCPDTLCPYQYMMVLLRDTYLQKRRLYYLIGNYVEDGGGHWAPPGHPLICLKQTDISPPGPWDHHLTFPKPLQELLQVFTKSIYPQDFHAARLVQRVIGLLYIKENMQKWVMANAHQMLCQFGLQHICDLPPSLSEPVQGVVDIYGHPESVVYNSGDHIPDHLHQYNAIVFPSSF